MNYRPSSTYDGVTAQQNHRKWKYCKMKMHLIHLTYQTSQLSLGYLKHPQNTYVSLQLGKIIQHKVYFIMKCWAAHAIYGIMNVLKVTNRLYGYRMAVRVPSTVYPPDYIIDRTLWLSSLPLPSIKKYHTAYQIQILQYGLYWMVSFSHHGEVENRKSSHHKSGIICISSPDVHIQITREVVFSSEYTCLVQ